jgi:hypothetical protein
LFTKNIFSYSLPIPEVNFKNSVKLADDLPTPAIPSAKNVLLYNNVE